MLLKTAKGAATALLALLICGNSASCTPQKMHSDTYYDMFDTFTTVIAYEEDEDRFEDNCKLVKELLYECSCLFDIYREYDGINNLATVNKNAGVSAVVVDERIIELLEYSKEVYTLTDGEINVAMGSVLRLWHDAREKNTQTPNSAPIPSAKELSAAAEHTDIDKVIIDREQMSVYLADSEMSLDVGAVAKGFASDLCADMLRERGVTDSYALNLGGNVIALGDKPEGKPWIISVQSPYSEYNNHIAKIEMRDASLVSSGNYERRFEYDGKEYHHIIDPDTLMPSEHFDSVSVIGASSACCDALSTALFCMPLEQGKALVASIDGVEAMWVKDSVITRSESFPEDTNKQ